MCIRDSEKCLDRVAQLQAPCLMQGQASLILDDGHSTSIVEALTSGPAGDLAMQASSTPQLGYGYYGPYVASVSYTHLDVYKRQKCACLLVISIRVYILRLGLTRQLESQHG